MMHRCERNVNWSNEWVKSASEWNYCYCQDEVSWISRLPVKNVGFMKIVCELFINMSSIG